MPKTFAKAPRPGTLEAMDAYERGGLGHDTTKPQANLSTYPQAYEPVEVQASISTHPQTHIHADQQTRIPTKAPEQMKRLSIDMPASLHWRFKVACVTAKKLMVEEVLAFIERRTEELEKG
jgi:hypothetical protein